MFLHTSSPFILTFSTLFYFCHLSPLLDHDILDVHQSLFKKCQASSLAMEAHADTLPMCQCELGCFKENNWYLCNFFLLSYTKFVFASLRTLTYFGITFILNVNLSLHQTLCETGSKYEVLWKRASSICHYLSIHLLTFSTSYTSAFRPLPHWTCQGNIFKCPIGSRTITVDSQSRL